MRRYRLGPYRVTAWEMAQGAFVVGVLFFLSYGIPLMWLGEVIGRWFGGKWSP